MHVRSHLLLMLMFTGGCAAPAAPPTQASPLEAGAEAAETTTSPTDGDAALAGALVEDPILNGAVWWRDDSAGECQEWTFVRFDGWVALERRTTEVQDGWSRSERVFYNITDGTAAEPRSIYAAGYDYEWIQPPGPDATSLPGQRSAMGCVATFDIIKATDEMIRWSRSGCVRGPGVWYRSKRRCEDDSR
jgi:hypothetical protein